jgi:hypothetical protein
MKKFMRKLAVLLLVLSLVMAGVLHAQTPNDAGYYDVAAHERARQQMLEQLDQEFLGNYGRSVAMVQNLYESFQMDENGRAMYPDYLGGFYIDDRGQLVLLIVNDSEASVSTDMETMQRVQGIVVREVAFTFASLWETMDFLNEFIFDNLDNPAAANALGWRLDVIGNQIVVELEEYTEEQIALFRRMVLDSPLLVFEQSQGMPMHSPQECCCDFFPSAAMTYPRLGGATDFDPHSLPITVRFGDRIYFYRATWPVASARIGWGSVGFRAYRPLPTPWSQPNHRGFVTVAHVTYEGAALYRFIRTGDIITNASGQILGTVARIQFHHLDSIFVAVNSNVTVSNMSAMGPVHPWSHYNLVGSAVFSEGARSGWRQGTITSFWSGHLTAPNGYRFPITNAVRANYRSDRGDSGGIVYTHMLDDWNSGVNGMHIGGWHGLHDSLFIPVNSITTAAPSLGLGVRLH